MKTSSQDLNVLNLGEIASANLHQAFHHLACPTKQTFSQTRTYSWEQNIPLMYRRVFQLDSLSYILLIIERTTSQRIRIRQSPHLQYQFLPLLKPFLVRHPRGLLNQILKSAGFLRSATIIKKVTHQTCFPPRDLGNFFFDQSKKIQHNLNIMAFSI
jgi:hypothetical protein